MMSVHLHQGHHVPNTKKEKLKEFLTSQLCRSIYKGRTNLCSENRNDDEYSRHAQSLFFLTSNAEAARATTLILGKTKPEPKIDSPPTAEEENVSISVPANSNLSNDSINVGNVTKLTGVPQIDYIYDPNLPRELNGYNLTDYPFYNSVPEDIDFKCDGLHDGFYASVPHKCQVYHHCLFGTRYDFLCANYTAFDQKTFICHFASEVDCKNSPRYFNRNEALYKATTTTTATPFNFPARRPQSDTVGGGGRRRRPYRRRKPSYEYYDEYEDVAEDDYYDEATGRRQKRPRPNNARDSYDDAEGSDTEKSLPPSGPNKSVFDRPRIAPKIRRPVPVNEREKYDYSSDSRAIVKEPTVEKKRLENTENSNRKQNGNKEQDYYESAGNDNFKSKEPPKDREREHKRDDYDKDRERDHKRDDYDKDRERDHKRDDYDKDRERDHKRDDYDKDRERERERERDRDRKRDERPYRRPPKKRRRPEEPDDEYDEYDDVRRYRNRNRPRYEEYGDYEYDDRPYRRNRDQEYRLRDHDYDRDRPYRIREPDYDRPRNRDRIRDDDRPNRNRDIDDRPVRDRDDERPLRSRDEGRPVRNRDFDKPNTNQDDRPPSRSRNEQLYRNDGKGTKTRNRDDERHYYSEDEGRYRDREVDENKRNKGIFTDESTEEKKEEPIVRPYKYNDEDEYTKQNPQVVTELYRDHTRNQERPLRQKDNSDKFGKDRIPVREEPEEVKIRSESSHNDRLRPVEQTERTFRNNDRGTVRAGNGQRLRSPQTSLDEEAISSEDKSKPVPASRPAYITKPFEAPLRKPSNDQSGRKTNGFRRPSAPKVPSTSEYSSEPQEQQRPDSPPEESFHHTTNRYEDRPFERPTYELENKEQQQPHRYSPPDDIRIIEQLNEKLQPIKPGEQIQEEFNQPRLKVPHEDSVLNEELAPRAPKFPQTSPRRRPFLPSRNGNSNLPRNLLPVGVKALQTPRGFQIQNKDPEESEPKTTNYQEKERQEPRYQFPSNTGGIEFRAKVSTAIGVDQPKLTPFFQDVQSSSELELPEYENSQSSDPSGVDADYYSNGPQKQEDNSSSKQESKPVPNAPQRQLNSLNTQDLSSSHNIPEYSSGQTFRQENNPNVNFRPTLKPTDFPQLSVPNSPSSQPAQENRNFEQAFKNRPLPSAINQQFNQQFTTKTPILFPPPAPKLPPPQSQLGPQSFYSENPKFHTTVKVQEPFSYNPAPTNNNFNAGIQLPIFQGGLRQNLPSVNPEPLRYENGQRQIDAPQENFKPLNLKFPSQNENLDDTDEFDVSLNDALQPISTLHPRNVATGVYLSNWQRNQQQQPAGFKRRVFQGAPPARQQNDSHEFNNRKQELPSRMSVESRNVPNQQKSQKFNTQRPASSTIHQRYIQLPLYHPIRPVTNTGKYFAVIT